MATTHKLQYTRWTCQATTGEPRPKSGYVAMMNENFETLKGCEWKQAGTLKATTTPHDFTATSYLDDSYDAFKMGGRWSAQTQRETAFAGMACYIFKMPQAFIDLGTSAADAETGALFTSISVPVFRDKFCLSGVKILVRKDSASTPFTDWSTITTGNVARATALANDAETLAESQTADGIVTIPLSGLGVARRPYLHVYVMLEDYADHWERYNAKESRAYAIEGSAMIDGENVEVTFSEDVAADEDDPQHIGDDYNLNLVYGDEPIIVGSDGEKLGRFSPFGFSGATGTYILNFREEIKNVPPVCGTIRQDISNSLPNLLTALAIRAMTNPAGAKEMYALSNAAPSDIDELSRLPPNSMAGFLPSLARLDLYVEDGPTIEDETAGITYRSRNLVAEYRVAPVALPFIIPPYRSQAYILLSRPMLTPGTSAAVPTSTSLAGIHVWASNTAMSVVPDSVCNNSAFFFPDVAKNVPSGWWYLGKIASTNSSTSMVEFALPRDLGNGCATILLAPYIDIQGYVSNGTNQDVISYYDDNGDHVCKMTILSHISTIGSLLSNYEHYPQKGEIMGMLGFLKLSHPHNQGFAMLCKWK